MSPYTSSSSSPPSWVMSDSPRWAPASDNSDPTIRAAPDLPPQAIQRTNTSSPSRTPSPGRERRCSVGKQTRTVIGFAPRPDGALDGVSTEARSVGNRQLNHLVIPTSIYNSPHPLFPPSRRDTPDLLPSPFTPTPITSVQRPIYPVSPGSPKTPYSADMRRGEPRVLSRRRSSYDVQPSSKAMHQGDTGEHAIASSSEEELGQSGTSVTGSAPVSATGSVPPVSLLTALLQQHQQSTTSSSPSSRRPSASITFGGNNSASTSEDERGYGSQRVKTGGILCSSSRDVTATIAVASAPAVPPHMTHYASDSGLEAVPEDAEDGEDAGDDLAETTPVIAPRDATGIMSTMDAGKPELSRTTTDLDKQAETRSRATPLSRQSSVAKSILIKEASQPSVIALQPSPSAAAGQYPAISPARAQPLPPSAPTTPAKAPRTSCIKFAVAQPSAGESALGSGSRRPSLALEQSLSHLSVRDEDAKIDADSAPTALPKVQLSMVSRELNQASARYCDESVETRAVTSGAEGRDDELAEEEDEEDDDEDDEKEEDDDDDDEEEDDEEDADSDDTEEDLSDSDGSGSGYEEDSEPGYSDNEPTRHNNAIRPIAHARRHQTHMNSQGGTLREIHLVDQQASPILTRLGSLGEQAVTMASSALKSTCWRREREGSSQRPPQFHLGGSYSDAAEDEEEMDEPAPPAKKSDYPFARPTHYRRRRPHHSDSFDQVADLHVASPSSYVKIDPKERTHRGRGLVSIVDAAPPERVDRQICSRHSSPPPRASRSRTSSTGYGKQQRQEVVPAGQSPSANHLKSRYGYRDGSRSGGGEQSHSRHTQTPERRRSEGDEVTDAAAVMDSQSELLDVKSAVAGWRSDDAAFQQITSRPITPTSTQPSTSRRPSFAGAASATKDVLRRASETLSTLTRAGLLGPGTSLGVEAGIHSEAPPTAVETENEEEYRLAAAILDSTPAFAEASNTAASPSAGSALQRALASCESSGS